MALELSPFVREPYLGRLCLVFLAIDRLPIRTGRERERKEEKNKERSKLKRKRERERERGERRRKEKSFRIYKWVEK